MRFLRVLVLPLVLGLPALKQEPVGARARCRGVTAPRGGGGGILQGPSAALEAYNGASERHPVRTNAITGAIVIGLGDAYCQRLTGSSDAKRFADAALIGGVWQSLFLPRIFDFVDRTVDRCRTLEGAASIVARTIMMECILSTGGNYFQLSSRRMLAGGCRDIGAALRGVNAQMPEVFKADWMVWPVYLTVAFAVIPPRMRTLTTAFMNAAWAVFISFMAARAGEVPASSVPSAPL